MKNFALGFTFFTACLALTPLAVRTSSMSKTLARREYVDTLGDVRQVRYISRRSPSNAANASAHHTEAQRLEASGQDGLAHMHYAAAARNMAQVHEDAKLHDPHNFNHWQAHNDMKKVHLEIAKDHEAQGALHSKLRTAIPGTPQHSDLKLEYEVKQTMLASKRAGAMSNSVKIL